MLAIYRATLAFHIACGFLGMALFWIAALAKKGSPLHIRIGRWYAYLMYAVIVTAFVTAGMALSDPDRFRPGVDPRETIDIDLFLSYLGLLSLSSTWNAVEFVQFKRDLSRLKNPLSVAINVGAVLGGLVMVELGFARSRWLFMALGAIGPISAGSHLRFVFRDLTGGVDPRTYFFRHMENMVSSGIALHTAFFAGGAASRFFPWLLERTGALMWIAPTIVGTAVLTGLQRRYRAGVPA